MLNDDGQGRPARDGGAGIARELARINLPLGIYTQFYWKVNLWNLLHFLDLRADAHAQHEIRAYADTLLGVVERWVPFVFEAFQDYVRQAASLSAQQLALVRRALGSAAPLPAGTAGLSPRELRELLLILPELGARLEPPG